MNISALTQRCADILWGGDERSEVVNELLARAEAAEAKGDLAEVNRYLQLAVEAEVQS